jgi:hypothetical protein
MQIADYRASISADFQSASVAVTSILLTGGGNARKNNSFPFTKNDLYVRGETGNDFSRLSRKQLNATSQKLLFALSDMMSDVMSENEMK